MIRTAIFNIVGTIVVAIIVIPMMIWFGVGYLAARNKSCDKRAADRRPRRAF